MNNHNLFLQLEFLLIKNHQIIPYFFRRTIINFFNPKRISRTWWFLWNLLIIFNNIVLQTIIKWIFSRKIMFSTSTMYLTHFFSSRRFLKRLSWRSSYLSISTHWILITIFFMKRFRLPILLFLTLHYCSYTIRSFLYLSFFYLKRSWRCLWRSFILWTIHSNYIIIYQRSPMNFDSSTKLE